MERKINLKGYVETNPVELQTIMILQVVVAAFQKNNFRSGCVEILLCIKPGKPHLGLFDLQKFSSFLGRRVMYCRVPPAVHVQSKYVLQKRGSLFDLWVVTRVHPSIHLLY